MIEVENLTMHYGEFRSPRPCFLFWRIRARSWAFWAQWGGEDDRHEDPDDLPLSFSGTAKVDGFDILENPIEARKRIGYLPETRAALWRMRVDEYLNFVGRARGLEGPKLAERLEWVKSACRLKSVWKHLSVRALQRIRPAGRTCAGADP